MAGWLWWLPGELLAEPHHCCSDAYQLLQALFCHKYHVLLIMSMMLFKTSSIVHKISSKMFSSSWSLSNLQYFLYYFLNHYFTFVKTVIPNAQQFTKLMQYFFSRTKACKFLNFLFLQCLPECFYSNFITESLYFVCFPCFHEPICDVTLRTVDCYWLVTFMRLLPANRRRRGGMILKETTNFFLEHSVCTNII